MLYVKLDLVGFIRRHFDRCTIIAYDNPEWYGPITKHYGDTVTQFLLYGTSQSYRNVC